MSPDELLTLNCPTDCFGTKNKIEFRCCWCHDVLKSILNLSTELRCEVQILTASPSEISTPCHSLWQNAWTKHQVSVTKFKTKPSLSFPDKSSVLKPPDWGGAVFFKWTKNVQTERFTWKHWQGVKNGPPYSYFWSWQGAGDPNTYCSEWVCVWGFPTVVSRKKVPFTHGMWHKGGHVGEKEVGISAAMYSDRACVSVWLH